jgi:hypothetical protein
MEEEAPSEDIVSPAFEGVPDVADQLSVLEPVNTATVEEADEGDSDDNILVVETRGTSRREKEVRELNLEVVADSPILGKRSRPKIVTRDPSPKKGKAYEFGRNEMVVRPDSLMIDYMCYDKRRG